MSHNRSYLPLERASRSVLAVAMMQRRVPRDRIAIYLGMAMSSLCDLARRRGVLLPYGIKLPGRVRRVAE
jgi:hypothetical protein